MAEVYRIEIPVEVQDQTSPGIGSASNRLNAFEKSARRTEKRLEKMQKTKWELTLYAMDRTAMALNNARRNLMSLTGKTWHISMGILGSPFRALDQMQRTLLSFPTLIAAVGTGVAAKKGFADPLALSNNYADARLAFGTMLGGHDQGDAFLGNLDTFAERTPFSSADVRELSQRMLAFKFGAEQVVPYLTAIGDWAGMMGKGAEGIDRVSLALGQMKAKGRVQGDEMLQLTEAGINAYDYLSAAMGKSTAQIMKMQEKGLVPADKAISAIVTGLQRDFGGGMKKQEATTRGFWNTIKETFDNRITRRWGDGLSRGLEPVLGRMVGYLDDNQDKIARWGDSLEATGKTLVTSVAGGIGVVGTKIGQLTSSDAWQEATTLGQKAKVTWDFIKTGFDDWWAQNNGVVSESFGNVGGFLGGALKGGIMGALGLIDPSSKLDDNSFLSAGQRAGKSFFDSFMEQLDASAIAKKLGNTTWNMRPGFDKSPSENILGGSLYSLLAVGIYKLFRGVLGAPGRLALGGVIGSDLGERFFGDQGSIWGGIGGAAAGLFAVPLAKKIIGKVKPNGMSVPKVTPTVPQPVLPQTPSPVLGPNGKSITGYEYRPPNVKTPATMSTPDSLSKASKWGNLSSKTLGWGGKFLGIGGQLMTFDAVDKLGHWAADWTFGHQAGQTYAKPGLFHMPFSTETYQDYRPNVFKRAWQAWHGTGNQAMPNMEYGPMWQPEYGPTWEPGFGMNQEPYIGPPWLGNIPSAQPIEQTININVDATQDVSIATKVSAEEIMNVLRSNGTELGNIAANEIAQKLDEIRANSH